MHNKSEEERMLRSVEILLIGVPESCGYVAVCPLDSVVPSAAGAGNFICSLLYLNGGLDLFDLQLARLDYSISHSEKSLELTLRHMLR